jgi:HPt (histidine-containing phosphotransfer) domain-containing protein
MVSSHTIPVFDKAAVLKRVRGNHNLADRVLYVFLQDMPRQLQSLREKVETGSLQFAGQQAHRIMGACSTVGGEAMRLAAHEIEVAAIVGDLECVRAKTEELHDRFEELSAAITTYIERCKLPDNPSAV